MQLNAMEEAPPQDFLEGSKNIRPFTVNPDLQNSVNVSIGDALYYIYLKTRATKLSFKQLTPKLQETSPLF